MTPEIFALCVSAALLELDTTYAFQLTLSRGIIAGPLLSLWTGDLMAGIQVGVFTELLFSDVNPLGGILPPAQWCVLRLRWRCTQWALNFILRSFLA